MVQVIQTAEDRGPGAAMGDGGAAYARYTSVAIALHWAMAALILFQLGIGFLMADALQAADADSRRWGFEQTQLHKSIGLTVLGLAVARLAWRILHPAPPLPPGMSWIERAGAHLSHVGFYVLMVGLPLTGWAMVSSSLEFGSLKTFYFGLFNVPHIPGLDTLPNESKGAVSGVMKAAHFWLAIGAVALLVLHVGAALKHHLVDRDAVLARMVPGVGARDGRPLESPLTAWSGARVVGALALLLAFGGLTGGVYWAEERKADLAAAAQPVRADERAPEPAPETGAPLWTPVMAESEIAFSGENSGSPFRGAFKAWDAEIRFDPKALERSRVRVRVDVSSAKTGDAQSDATLTEKDWFDAAAHPTAVFEAARLRKGEGPDGYVAEGALTLRGVTQPLELPFELTITGDRAEMSGTAVIDRVAFGVGEAADASGDWVSKEIPLEISVVALRGEAAAAPAASSSAPIWAPVMAQSALTFSGLNSGSPFEGAFKAWDAAIQFDPEDLAASSARVVIDMSSARTGDAQSDATLLEADWFDAAAHPQAVFEARRFVAGDGPGRYLAEGALTIRGVTQPVTLPFSLEIKGGRAEMTAALVINRMDFGIGAAADATGDWVSLEIPLEISLVATSDAR